MVKSRKSAALCQRILDRIAKEGLSLRKACEADNLPLANFLFWCNNDQTLAEQYARAREIRADLLFEEIIEIADEASNDTIVDSNGDEKPNSEWITRSKLRVDARKWVLAKMQPKKFGDKIEVDNKGDMGLTVKIVDFSKGDNKND